MMANDADAADAAQEALIVLVRRLDRFDGRSRFATWAYRVTTNVCLDELRRRSRRPVPAEPAVGAEASVDPDVDTRLDVEAALATLSPEYRAAVVLRDLCDLDYAEIAEAFDIPPGTVRSRIARGRARIADQLRNPTIPPERPTTER
jgi:RNA polymerase sigma-70 factor (ECF subfamily)